MCVVLQTIISGLLAGPKEFWTASKGNMIYQKGNPTASFNSGPTLLGWWCILFLRMYFSSMMHFILEVSQIAVGESWCEDKFLSRDTCFEKAKLGLWHCWVILKTEINPAPWLLCHTAVNPQGRKQHFCINQLCVAHHRELGVQDHEVWSDSSKKMTPWSIQF